MQGYLLESCTEKQTHIFKEDCICRYQYKHIKGPDTYKIYKGQLENYNYMQANAYYQPLSWCCFIDDILIE